MPGTVLISSSSGRPVAIHHEIGATPAFGAAGVEARERELRELLLRLAPTRPEGQK